MPRHLAYLALLAVSSALPACSDGGPVTTLADADEIFIDVKRSDTLLDMTLRSVPESFQLGPSFRVTLNGRDADKTEPGIYDPDFGSHDPRAYFRLRAEDRVAPATLVFSDSSRTVTMQLGDHLVERTLRVVEPADGIVRTGSRVELAWSSPAELQPPGSFYVDTGYEAKAHRIAVAGDRITFTMREVTADKAGGICVRVFPPSGGLAPPCDATRCTLDKGTRACASMTFSTAP